MSELIDLEAGVRLSICIYFFRCCQEKHRIQFGQFEMINARAVTALVLLTRLFYDYSAVFKVIPLACGDLFNELLLRSKKRCPSIKPLLSSVAQIDYTFLRQRRIKAALALADTIGRKKKSPFSAQTAYGNSPLLRKRPLDQGA